MAKVISTDVSVLNDKTIEIIEGTHHELLNDLDREKVLEMILGWVKNRI